MITEGDAQHHTMLAGYIYYVVGLQSEIMPNLHASLVSPLLPKYISEYRSDLNP
jgi:hypothetical protein